MYTQAFGLKKSPFNITSDPEFFFESSSHKEALATLLYGIKEKKGIISITGEVGTGKTTLCKIILGQLSLPVRTSIILNPYFSEVQLLRAIIEDFGVAVKQKTRLEIIKKLNYFLLDVSLAGGNAVLIIDESQHLSNTQLEQLRLLSNLETSHEKLLQIILVGQPELENRLNQFNLRQIRQRIFVKCKLRPLPEEEVPDYVNFRLNKAGQGNLNILPDSFKVIYEFSQGIPRLINMLCDRALLLGFLRETTSFDAALFKACGEELK